MKINTLDFNAQNLRREILNLAVRGKLVQQESDDGFTVALLDKVKLEKEKLIKEKKIKKSKPLPEITEDEKPFDIPDNWEWVRFGDIGNIVSGGTPKKAEKAYWEDGNIPWITPATMSKTQDSVIFNSEDIKTINRLGLAHSSAQLIPAGSIVVSSRAPIGYVNIVPFNYSTNQGCKSVNTFTNIYNKYVYYAIKYAVPDMYRRASGTTFKEISGTKFGETVIPLPPLAEQKRIATKISQLFDQIDKIESASQQYIELQSSLRSKLLDVAMRGKLVKQDFSDEPVSVLLDEIKSEKDRLVKEKRIRNSKPLPEITDNEKPYDIPNNWEWVRLGDIIVTINGDRGKNYPGKKYWQSTGRPFLNAACLTSGKYIDKAKFNYISDERYELLRSGFVNSDDILYCIRGSLGKVGMVNIDDGAIASSLIIIRKIIADQNMEFLYYLLCSSINGMFIKNHRNGTAQPNIPGRDLLKMVVPLPPLEEQKRIVDKLEKIFAYL